MRDQEIENHLERCKFEDWAKKNGLKLQDLEGQYLDALTASAWGAWCARSQEGPYPMQPIFIDDQDEARFESNPIVEWLACELSDKNKIESWCLENNVDPKYKEQLAQLTGSSVRDYRLLNCVSEESDFRTYLKISKLFFWRKNV